MVEGHQCHRVAHAHRKTLLNKKFEATSPNKRFTDGAAAIHNKYLSRIEVHGKNLFYFFTPHPTPDEHASIIVRIHFGMSGAFRTFPLPGPDPVRDTVRLQLLNRDVNVVAHLSAMSVEHGDVAFYAACTSKLGQDPLRDDADPEALWGQVQRCKKPIGLVLMDQSMVAGPGNIYRAEILFKAGVHPEQPAWTVPREAFDRIWRECVLLLQRGFQTGSIVTVDPQEAKALGQPWTRRCGSPIRTWDMATRTVYACETCQPLHKSDQAALTPPRRKALAAATTAKLFRSHCAPDPDDTTPAKLPVARLRAALQAAGLSPAGTKAALVARLEQHQARPQAPATPPVAKEQPPCATVAQLKEALRALGLPTGGTKAVLLERLAHASQQPGGSDIAALDEKEASLAAALGVPGEPLPTPGTGHLGAVVSARDAAQEKLRAGEGRHVEHVALHTPASDALVPPKRKRKRSGL